jgi:hypothetical protein
MPGKSTGMRRRKLRTVRAMEVSMLNWMTVNADVGRSLGDYMSLTAVPVSQVDNGSGLGAFPGSFYVTYGDGKQTTPAVRVVGFLVL